MCLPKNTIAKPVSGLPRLRLSNLTQNTNVLAISKLLLFTMPISLDLSGFRKKNYFEGRLSKNIFWYSTWINVQQRWAYWSTHPDLPLKQMCCLNSCMSYHLTYTFAKPHF